MSTYRCWEEERGSEPNGLGEFEAMCPEAAAEQYVSRRTDIDFSLCGDIVVNVSAPSGAERVYWTVEVVVEVAYDFIARRAVSREDAP